MPNRNFVKLPLLNCSPIACVNSAVILLNSKWENGFNSVVFGKTAFPLLQNEQWPHPFLFVDSQVQTVAADSGLPKPLADAPHTVSLSLRLANDSSGRVKQSSTDVWQRWIILLSLNKFQCVPANLETECRRDRASFLSLHAAMQASVLEPDKHAPTIRTSNRTRWGLRRL